MFTVVIIIVLGIAGAAALAIWLVDERGKMKAARQVNDTLNEINKTLDEVGVPRMPKPPRPWSVEPRPRHDVEPDSEKIARNMRGISGYQPRTNAPDPSEVELPTGSGASEPFVEIDGMKVPGAVRCCRCGRPFSVQTMDGHRYCPSCYEDWFDKRCADAVNEEEFKDLVHEKLRKRIAADCEDDALERGIDLSWHPLPMKELRREWENR